MSNREMSEKGTQFNLGKFITGEAGRDAVHIPVAPSVSGEDLMRGDRLAVISTFGNLIHVRRALPGETPIGVVDPFLQEVVIPSGARFYMFLFPNTITNVAHVWEHPIIDGNPETGSDSPEENDVEVGTILEVAYFDTDGEDDYCCPDE